MCWRRVLLTVNVGLAAPVEVGVLNFRGRHFKKRPVFELQALDGDGSAAVQGDLMSGGYTDASAAS